MNILINHFVNQKKGHSRILRRNRFSMIHVESSASISGNTHDPHYSLSVIMPAYNEANRIGPVLNDYCSEIERNRLAWNIIVSIDGSDGTEAIVDEFASRHSFITKEKKNGRNGKGEAIKRVIHKVNSDYVMLADSDNSVSLAEISKCIGYLKEYDAVFPDRYADRANKMPLKRRLPGRAFNILVKALLGIRVNDTQCGYKLFRTEKLKESISKVGITNAFFDVSLLYHMNKKCDKSISVPVSYAYSDGSTFSLFSLALGHGISLLAFRTYHSRFGRLVPQSLRDLYMRKFRWA